MTQEEAAGGGADTGQRGSQQAAGAEGAAAGQRRRARNQEVQEVVDELAQESKRVTLLECEEAQLKGREHVSRLLFIFNIADEKKTQNAVEQEFSAWREREERGKELTGVLLFASQTAVSFLEGPTEMCFKALEFFDGLSREVTAATPASTESPSSGKRPTALGRNESNAPAAPAVPRAALISTVRVLYFTELHGVQASIGWCSLVNPAKLSTQPSNIEQDACPELVFMLYKKMLLMCLKVQEGMGEEADADKLQSHYKRNADMMPTPDEVMLLLHKSGTDFFFTFQEFHKVFMMPFQLVLHSELLWPIPPPLSY